MLNYEYPPIGGGTGVACEQLLGELAKDPDLAIDLVTSGLGASLETEQAGPDVTIHRLPVGKRDQQFWRPGEIARWTARALAHSRRLVRERSYDLCHAWAGWPSGVPAWVLRRRLPYLVALRGSDVPGYSRRLALLDFAILRRVSREIWNSARLVVAVSEPLRVLALQTRPGLRIDVIPNGVDLERFAPGPERDPFEVLFVGRLIERKGAEDLVRAFGDVAAAQPRARLVIAGSGPERRSLERLAAASAGADRIRFLGQVDRATLPEVYRGAGVFVIPSRTEGMPNVMLEAMASGLPIVCTPAAAAGVIDGNGLLVEPGRPEAIRAALERYLGDAALRTAHARKSRELAESMSWSSVATWYREVYEGLLA
jgi:glycosyltransferase involved in cell wall biosynthesis